MTKHFEGKPCKYGHTLRLLSNRACVACNAERNKRWRREDPKRANARNRAYRAGNKNKVREADRKNYARTKAADPRKAMLQCAKHRAKERGVLCTITLDDIVIPDRCPLLGAPLTVNTGRHGPNSPSLDRIFNAYGYVRGNVIVVSHQANARKGELNSEDLRSLADRLAEIELRAARELT